MRLPIVFLEQLEDRCVVGVTQDAAGLRVVVRVRVADQGSAPEFESASCPLHQTFTREVSVLLKGTVQFPTPAEVLPCHLSTTGAPPREGVETTVTLYLVADRPVDSLPCDGRYARDASGASFDPGVAGALVLPLAPRATLRLHHGNDSGPSTAWTLPEPPILGADLGPTGFVRVPLTLTAVEVDLSTLTIVTVFGGRWTGRRDDVERFVVATTPGLKLAYGRVRLAAEGEKLTMLPVGRSEQAIVEAAELELSMGAPKTPRLPLPEYAEIAVELQRSRDRASVLARHGFDETTWLAEERAWLAGMARDAESGDVRLALSVGEHIQAIGARRELSREDYLAIKRELDADSAIELVLRERGIALAEWIAIDARFGGEPENV
ncbi:MAG: hypothetical protein U0271_38895 [Polyangiaceae bacterium]